MMCFASICLYFDDLQCDLEFVFMYNKAIDYILF